MLNTGKLAGQTLFIIGASRGIGKAIALKAAKDGANVILAKSHPKLPGTIFTAAKEIEDIGGNALPCVVDIRDEDQVMAAVDNAVNNFGGIDILVNNPEVISLTTTTDTDMEKYDLMHNINTRGTFLASKICIPHLKKSENPHILNISPPLDMSPQWFRNHVAYTMSKYGMSMCVLGMAKEFKSDGIAVNALWPRTAIHTAAIEMPGEAAQNYSRKPEIMSDAAYAILTKDSRSISGQFLIDDEVLMNEGITDMEQYAVNPENADNLTLNLFLNPDFNQENLIEEPSKSVGGKTNSEVEKLFEAIQGSLNENLVSKTQAVFVFNLIGEDTEELWFIDLKNGSGSAGRGKPTSDADMTLTMDVDSFLEMCEGKLKATNAITAGKLKITGKMDNVTKLKPLMGQLKSEL